MSPADKAGDGAQSGAPTARRMVLGAQLRRLRESAGVSRADAGYQIRSSESKMSRIELGRVGFKERDVADLLTMYGVDDPAEREAFLEMVKQSSQPGWWHRYSDVIPTWFTDYVGLEESAARIQTYELQFVPGLLQTQDYATAVFEHGGMQSGEEVEQRLQLRLRRQKNLARPDAPRLWAVIDESVLFRPIGGPAVLKAQLGSLLEASDIPNVSLQILPYVNSGYAAEGSFTILRFAESELPTIVYVEHLTGSIYLDQVKDVESYGRAIDRLAVDSMTPDESRDYIAKRRAEI
ncbi:helix-turn-helix domain-containing protein [Haloactinopolyspora alba]|nr:helix-turn-helix transcriptional regulator [Haloactinopolyspora alba]